MFGTLRKEFCVEKLTLHLKNSRLVTESWILPLPAFLLLRSTMAIFCVVITIVSGVDLNSPKWFIYLTVWSYVALTISFVGLSFMSLIHFADSKKKKSNPTAEVRPNERVFCNDETYTLDSNKRSESIAHGENHEDTCERKPFVVKTLRLLWIVSSGAGLFVTLLYWTLLFRNNKTFFIDIALHALNTVFILVELLAGSIPVHLLHAVYYTCFLVVYVVFTVVYWGAGGHDPLGKPYIYKVLDYEDGNPAAIVGVLLISVVFVIPLVQLLLFGCYQLRCYFMKRTNRESSGSETAADGV